MARTTPRVQDATLISPADTAQPITVGTPAWYTWLTQATTFAFISTSGRFTARKERRGHADGYWRAYRKHAGKVSIAYLGKSADLTLECLQDVAATLADARVPERQPMNPTAVPMLASDAATSYSVSAPTDTITFLLTAIDGYALLWAKYPQAMPTILAGYTAILSKTITAGSGRVFTTNGDVVSAAFASPMDAVMAALVVQRALGSELWNEIGPLHVCMAMHTGVVAERNSAYVGDAVRRVEQFLAVSHGGQILLSQVTQELLHDQLPDNAVLRDLGTYYLGATRRPEHLFQLMNPDLPAEFPPLRPPARRPYNLPYFPTPLIGREYDVAAVAAALRHPNVRLVTLTGPGGVGKTRVGQQVGTELRDAFADGVFFVDLSALNDPDFVVPTIAQTLGIVDVGGSSLLIDLRDYLASKDLLLLLDNFEQVLPAATHIATLLSAAPQLKLLITSRAVLHLAAEHEFPIAPLALPKDQSLPLDQVAHYGAIALFMERAQAVQPDFAVTDETLSSVVEICRRLDGLPLAIELAAVRIKLFPPALLLSRLDRRLPLLTGGARDLPARQQTLRAAIDWSYQLLNSDTQTLLQRLAVFEGGFTLAAAEAVCGIGDCRLQIIDHNDQSPISNLQSEILDGLTALIDQSLLRSAEDSANAPRFMLLETIREYALERLEQSGDALALRQRHTAYYLRLAEQAEPELRSADRRMWLDRLETEHANLRAALTWTLAQGTVELTAQLASMLGVFWEVRDRREGRDWLAAALASGALLDTAVRAKALLAAGWLARAQHDQPTAIRLLEESLALYHKLGDERGCAAAMTDLGWTLATFGADTTQARTLLDEGLARYRTLGDRGGIAKALHGLGWVEQHRALGDLRGIAWLLTGLSWVEQYPGILTTARALYAESLDFARSARDAQAIVWALQSLGVVAAAQRDYATARAFEEERLAIERSQNNRYGIASAQRQLGKIALRQGDIAAARTWLVESLHLDRAIGDKNTTAFALWALGEIEYAAGNNPRAMVLLEEALAYFRELEDRHRMAQVYALLAQVTLDQQDDATARSMARQSMALARAVGNPETISLCLAGMADSAARHGRATWAAQLWGAAERQREATQAHRVPVEPADRARLKEAACASLGVRAFGVAWAAGRALTSEEALTAPETITPGPASTGAGSASCHPALTRPSGLTQREWEVLLLVAEGLSNTQIAERLVISVATVKTYLSAIYSKLGVSSRTAAMRYVFDHHLH